MILGSHLSSNSTPMASERRECPVNSRKKTSIKCMKVELSLILVCTVKLIAVSSNSRQPDYLSIFFALKVSNNYICY